MWLQLFFGLQVFPLWYSSGGVRDPVSPQSLELCWCAVNREDKWISMGQSLLEPVRTFPWVSACFHSTPFTADFLKELSSPLGVRFAKELSRWEAAWENLLVNAEQKQQGVELSGGAERRFPEAWFQRSVPTCFPIERGPWEMLCRLALKNGSSRDLSTLSSAETLRLQSHFINYPTSKPHKVWIYLLVLLAHALSGAQGNIEA